MDKIELKKTEADQLTFRENLIKLKVSKIKTLETEMNCLKAEIALLSSEGSYFLKSIVEKYNVQGEWERSGDYLVPVKKEDHLKVVESK